MGISGKTRTEVRTWGKPRHLSTPARAQRPRASLRRPRRMAAAAWMARALLPALASVLAFTPSADAFYNHNPLFKIEEVPAGPGVTYPGNLGSNGEVHLTGDSGHVWLSEKMYGTGYSRVDEFNASNGEFIRELTHSPEGEYLYMGKVAVADLPSGEHEFYIGENTEAQGTIVAVLSESGAGQATWTGADTPAGSFGPYEVPQLAVDNSPSVTDPAKGDVYVPESNRKVVDVFAPEGEGKEKYVGQLPPPAGLEEFAYPSEVAVDRVNGDVLVLDGGAGTVDIYEPELLGGYKFLGALASPSSSLTISPQALDASDAEGDIYLVARVSENGASPDENAVLEYGPAGGFTGRVISPSGFGGEPGPLTVAADPSTGNVFVGTYHYASPLHGPIYAFSANILVPDVETGAATEVKAQSATLEGTVNPDKDGAATCQFAIETSTAPTEAARCSEGIAEAGSPQPVHADLSGLQPDTTYDYRLQASNANGTNPGEPWQTMQFTTTGPGLHGESASAVTANSATLSATINPHRANTSYYFEYGSDTKYGSQVPSAPGTALGAGDSDIPVALRVQNLTSSMVYHYRAVVIGEVNGETVTIDGPDQTFTTQIGATDFALPDGRAWELVTPPNKHGGAVLALGNEQGDEIQAAQSGNAITFGAASSLAANPAGSNSPESTQTLSVRQAPDVWSTTDITTPYTEGGWAVSVGFANEYKLFSPDLSLGAIQPPEEAPIPPLPAGSEFTDYLRLPSGAFEPLVTSANVPAGVKFGPNRELELIRMWFESASPDLHHILLRSHAPLALPLFEEKPGGYYYLYEWSAGHLQLASQLNGEPIPAYLGAGQGDLRNTISSDGSRIVWHGNYSPHENLYLQDMTSGEAIQLDAGQGGAKPEQESRSIYRTASSDDSRIFFTSPERLTPDATASREGTPTEDLYVFEVTSKSGEPLAGSLTDLTVAGGEFETADVRGVIGASEDGSAIYFVANGVLGDGAANGARPGHCAGSEGSASLSCNLYVERYDDAAKAWAPPTFIAALSSADEPSWGASYAMALSYLAARVSPNGQFLTFASERSLTGYDNRDANSGALDEEVYLYDSQTGHLACASCNPTGARPAGLFEGKEVNERLIDYRQIWHERWIAANIPGWTNNSNEIALYQSRYLSNSGRLFFNSADALVPADVNGKADVYEYEPLGVGSCKAPTYGQSAAEVFVPGSGGCVGLISSGSSLQESSFMDASESGEDVFFLTLAQLSTQDYDGSLDVYDAHECTASAPCAPVPATPPPPCTSGDSCKTAPSPQPAVFGATPSETFSGTGNVVPTKHTPRRGSHSSSRAHRLAAALRACRRRPKHKRTVCERRAKRKYGHRQSRAGLQSNLSAIRG